MNGIESDARHGAMSCPDARDAIQEALDGLPPDPRLCAHVVACVGCRKYQEGLESLVARLGAATGAALRGADPAALPVRTGRASKRPGGTRPRSSGRVAMPPGVWQYLGPLRGNVLAAGVVAASILVMSVVMTSNQQDRVGPPQIATVYEEADPDSILCLFGSDPAPDPEDLAR